MRLQPILFSNIPEEKHFPANLGPIPHLNVFFNGKDVTNNCYAFLSILGLGYVKCYTRKDGNLFVDESCKTIARDPTRYGRVKIKQTKLKL